MGKKNSAAATTTVITVTDDEIKTLIQNTSIFFDKIVELIPARFYLPSNDDKPWFQGLSKQAKHSAKRQTKANLKIVRKNRFDPEKSSKTTVEILNESLESDKLKFNDSDDDDKDDKDDEANDNEVINDKAMTYEELQLKMKRKLEVLRGGRSRGDGFSRRMEKREEWKRKRGDFEGGKAKGKGKEKEKKEKEEERVVVEKQVENAVNDIEFGKVKLASSIDDVVFNKNKKRKLSKEEELKKALELEEAKKDPEKGDIVKTQHAWKAATDRAMGIKVHDNPDRLQKSLDNEMRKQKKSKETWKKRMETTANHKKSKQEKRKANINAKVNSTKQAKIAKREKKFMRPGFEGRKEGFITGE